MYQRDGASHEGDDTLRKGRRESEETASGSVERLGDLDEVYERIREILSQARAHAWQAVNWAMVAAYWEVGRAIVEEEQRGSARAEYGRRLIEEISGRLSDG